MEDSVWMKTAGQFANALGKKSQDRSSWFFSNEVTLY